MAGDWRTGTFFLEWKPALLKLPRCVALESPPCGQLTLEVHLRVRGFSRMKDTCTFCWVVPG